MTPTSDTVEVGKYERNEFNEKNNKLKLVRKKKDTFDDKWEELDYEARAQCSSFYEGNVIYLVDGEETAAKGCLM